MADTFDDFLQMEGNLRMLRSRPSLVLYNIYYTFCKSLSQNKYEQLRERLTGKKHIFIHEQLLKCWMGCSTRESFYEDAQGRETDQML